MNIIISVYPKEVLVFVSRVEDSPSHEIRCVAHKHKMTTVTLLHACGGRYCNPAACMRRQVLIKAGIAAFINSNLIIGCYSDTVNQSGMSQRS